MGEQPGAAIRNKDLKNKGDVMNTKELELTLETATAESESDIAYEIRRLEEDFSNLKHHVSAFKHFRSPQSRVLMGSYSFSIKERSKKILEHIDQIESEISQFNTIVDRLSDELPQEL